MAAKELKEHKDLDRGTRRIRGRLHFAGAQKIRDEMMDSDGVQSEERFAADWGRW
jgi:hypothetical protein